ncbi:MAG: radical SAM protein [Candidatus Heimdallarchaeota archaeon]|nr:radical SAM protein [Candidatus Heimdallarchaeota archaeon]
MTIEIPLKQDNVYSVPFLTNDHGEFVLWFYTGSKCNLSCTHCYVNAGPDADQHAQLTLETFRSQLQSVKNKKFSKLEIYFTGGEPFLNTNLLIMFKESLELANVTVLTNSTRISKHIAKKLQVLQEESTNNIYFRVSLDGPEQSENDAIRGKNAFDRATRGIKNLIDVGFNPIVTAMRSWLYLDSLKMENKYEKLLSEMGIPKDKQLLKILPPLRIGREADRDRPYLSGELFTKACFTDYDYKGLQCSKCRIVSERGVWVCPILINDDEARMGRMIDESFHSYPMKQMACWTCRMEGMVCTND